MASDNERYYLEYYPRYGDVFSAEDTSRQVDFISRVCGLSSPSRVLDVGCGSGRHSIELARRGFDVTALDASETLLATARQRASESGVSIRFIHARIEDIASAEEFSAVVSMWTSFGYFGPEGDMDAMRRMSNALVPGGVLLLDAGNWIGPAEARDWDEYEDHFELVERKLRLPERRSDTTIISVEKADGSVRRYGLHIYLYTPARLRQMMRAAGLVPVGVWGSCNLEDEFQIKKSHQCVVAARK